MPEWKNKLYFGDNFNMLREHIKDESIDLIFLAPPFHSTAKRSNMRDEDASR